MFSKDILLPLLFSDSCNLLDCQKWSQTNVGLGIEVSSLTIETLVS